MCALSGTVYFLLFLSPKVPLTFCLFSCSLTELCWTVGKHCKPESFSSCRLTGSRKSGTVKFLPPPVSFGQSPPLLAERRKKSRVGCTKHKKAKADSMEDGRRREAPLSFGECPKKEALARNAEEKKKRIKKEKVLSFFSVGRWRKKKKSHTRQKSSPTKKRKKLFSAPFLHRSRTLLRPFLSTFPSSLPSLQIAKTAAPFLLVPSSPNLLSSLVRRCPQPPPHEREGGSLSGNLNHPFPSYEGPSSLPLLLFLSNPSEGICRRTRRRRRRTEKKGKKKLVLVLLLLYGAIAASLPPSSFHDGKTFFCLPPFLCPVPAPPPLPFSILSTLSSSSSLLHFPGKVGEENNRVGRRRLQKKVSPPPHSIAPS